MAVIKLRKKQITILELAGLTAWIGVCLCTFRFNFVWGVALVLWTISFLISWFITNSKWSVFQAWFAGTFCVTQAIFCGFVAMSLFSAFSDYPLSGRSAVFFGGAILVLGAIIGGIVGSYLHFSIVRNQDAESENGKPDG